MLEYNKPLSTCGWQNRYLFVSPSYLVCNTSPRKAELDSGFCSNKQSSYMKYRIHVNHWKKWNWEKNLDYYCRRSSARCGRVKHAAGKIFWKDSLDFFQSAPQTIQTHPPCLGLDRSSHWSVSYKQVGIFFRVDVSTEYVLKITKKCW